MARKTTLCVFLLLGNLLQISAADVEQPAKRPVLGLGIVAGVAVADDPTGYSPAFSDFFTPKVQGMGAVNILLDVPLVSSFSVGIGVQGHAITISNYAGGWIYRSHWGGGIRLSGAYDFMLSKPSRPLQLRLGAAAGGSVNFDLETFTTLLLFYPGVFLEPYLELSNPKREKSSLALVMPIDYYFRRDLELYLSLGFGVVWRYTLE